MNDPGTQIFSTSLAYKISYTLSSCLLLALALFVSISGEGNSLLRYLGVVFPNLFVSYHFFVLAFRYKIIITQQEFIYVGVYRKKSLPLHTIKGQKTSMRRIILYPATKDYPKLVISAYNHIANAAKLRQLVTDNFEYIK